MGAFSEAYDQAVGDASEFNGQGPDISNLVEDAFSALESEYDASQMGSAIRKVQNLKVGRSAGVSLTVNEIATQLHGVAGMALKRNANSAGNLFVESNEIQGDKLAKKLTGEQRFYSQLAKRLIKASYV